MTYIKNQLGYKIITSGGLGIVSPNARGQDQRIANNLVLIHINQ